MPLTLRPKNELLATMLDSLIAGGIITDINAISVVRQLTEGFAAALASLTYDLYTLNKMYYIGTATDEDLVTRMLDQGLPPDLGQAASDPVTFTRANTWTDDIPLPAQQLVQATLADGTVVLYRSLADAILQPQGRSVSGQAPSPSVTSGLNDQLAINLDGDGARTITLGTQSTAATVASAIQTAVRALTALNAANQPAYTGFRCNFGTTTPGAYTLRSGTTGPTSSVVVTATGHSGTVTLKLGRSDGGTESLGQTSIDVPVLCDQIGVMGNVGAGQIHQQATAVTGIFSVANALAFANGREPASDDANRQDLVDYLQALGRGTPDSIERAVYHTVGADGQRHVMSAQVVEGASNVQVFVSDGRSLSLGAQPEVVTDVQAELDGTGQTVGGWLPAGVVAGVAPATLYLVNVTATVLVGPTPDLALAQQAIAAQLYTLLFQWPVGVPLSYAQVTRRIDQTVADMLGVTFTSPAEFTTTPPRLIVGVIGRKLMPGALSITVSRA